MLFISEESSRKVSTCLYYLNSLLGRTRILSSVFLDLLPSDFFSVYRPGRRRKRNKKEASASRATRQMTTSKASKYALKPFGLADKNVVKLAPPLILGSWRRCSSSLLWSSRAPVPLDAVSARTLSAERDKSLSTIRVWL